MFLVNLRKDFYLCIVAIEKELPQKGGHRRLKSYFINTTERNDAGSQPTNA